MRFSLSLILIAFLLFAQATVSGQPGPQPPEVGRISVEFDGVRNVSEQAVLAQIQVNVGEPISQTLIDRSIRSLYETGLFDNIEVLTDEMPDGRAALTFVVRSRYKVEEILVTGNKKITERRLRKEITSQINGSLNERRIDRDAEKMEEYYLKRGYSDVSVDYEIDRNPETGFGTVTYIVDEGAKLKIKDITFNGVTAFKDKQIIKEMDTKEWGLFSWLTGGGRYNETDLEEDLNKIRAFYRDNGYLDVEVPESAVSISYPSENRIQIEILVNEGRQYQVGDIMIEGESLFPEEELRALLKLNTGDVFSASQLDEDVTTLDDYYGRLGYLETRIRAERRPNLDTGAIDIIYTIREGELNYVESIQIDGNTKTKSIVILRELALAPGDVFNTVRMKASEARLKNTRFFEDVKLQPVNTNVPNRKDLSIDVREARTGNLTFGAGFSSLENGIVFVELTQGNFDLFNARSFFQGDGQKFRLRLQVGSESNQIVLAFEEPWLFEQRLALGFEAFRSETDFVSSVYDELRTGVEIYLRKRLIELWEGRLSYRIEQVNIDDVDIANAPLIVIEEGQRDGRVVSKVGFTLLRDTRDNLIFTSRGNRVSFTSEFAGLGGDTDYLRLEARGATYHPTFEFGGQVVSILGRIGSITSLNDEATPFFDRFYLGGPGDLRGFDFREVGPKDEGPPQADVNDIDDDGNVTETFGGTLDPLGGDSYAFASVEYTFQLAEPLRLAFFYDWGFVNRSDFDFDMGDYNSNYGIGVRILVLNAPLRLDYGIPITTDEFNDEGGQFNFSFGTRF